MDVNDPLDNLDKLRGIPSEELFEKLLSDSAFVEYLNTFLSLPVFGKRLIYNPAEDNFSIDPPPPRTCYHLPHYRVKKWVRKERLRLFWKTDLFLEYLLYVHLKKAAGSSGTSVDLDQTRTYLGTVEGMRTFHRFLRGTSGQKILLFWIEAERFRRVTKKEHRRFVFRDIQAKYLRSGSPRELPEIMKWISICGGTPDLERKSSFKFPKSVSRRMYLSDASIFSGNVFIPGQRMALERLISYWVPKYIEHKKRLEKFIEEKRCGQSVFRPEIRRFSPVRKVEQEIPLSKTKSQEEIDEFMEAQRVSSTESVTETEEEIRARKLEEWKRWFWEGVDYNLTGSDDQVEPPDDMPLELRRLGGIREAPPSSPVTPEPDDASLNAIGEEEENEMFPDWQSLEAGRERIVENSLSFPNPPTSSPITPLEEKSISEPAFATADFMRWRREEEKLEQKAAEKKESLEEERVSLPKLRPPYAQIPSSASTKLKTVYEALASQQSLMTEELYESSPESSSPFRSLEASPPQSALLALRRVSASRVIPFKEVGHEIAAMVNEPRNVYPRDTLQRERLVLFKSDTDVSVSDELSLPTLVALTADKLAGGPLREYLEKTQQDQALSSLQFWEDAQRYLSPSEDFGSYNKYHSAKTLIATYIAPGSPRQIEMGMRVRDDLMRLLPEEKGDHLLSSFVKKSVQAVALQWSEYVRSDEDHFISSVGIRRKSASKKKYISSVTKPGCSALQKWRALKLAVSLGVSGFSLGQGDEDEDESETVGNDFVIPSLRDYEKEKEILHARSKRPSHFYGHVTRQDDDASEGNKKLTGIKMRPPKPRCFIDVIYDSLQLMWFKRFLTEKQCEAPLLFWQAVENMKMNCKDGKARQARAMTIVKKYFTNIPTTSVEYLHCKAEIIRDIPLLDKATPPMLVSAQACVARSMEENWYAEYLATFPEDEGEGENFANYAMRNTLAGVYKMAAHGKTKGLWAMFAHNVMCFQRGIHNSESLQEFKQFLRKECKATVEHNLRRHALHPTRRVINSKFVNTDRLISDIEFWMEVERFKYQAENAAECARSGNYTLEDENLLLEKARTIVKCYIDSDIPPRLQINIPNDLADNIIGLVQNGIVERGLFHEAALSVFTALMYFWKKFSAERTSKLEEEVQPPSTDKRPNSIKRLMSAIDGIPYRKVYVTNEEDAHWSFSLNHGLRLLIPLCKFLMAKQVATQMDQRSQPLSDNVSLSGSTP